MLSNRAERLWTIVLPEKWPELPAEMSFSLLLELETCPRRWALSKASYSDIWERSGYPPKLYLSSLMGTTIHLAVEEITKALARARCPSLRSAEAVAVIKEIGGYSTLLVDCIARALAPYSDNPRVAHLLDLVRQKLRSQIPEMRLQVQSFLAGLILESRSSVFEGKKQSANHGRFPLGLGVHPEVEVRARGLRWRGKLDLLSLANGNCEIIDFKTGEPSDHHRFQLMVYALLWYRDVEINPTGRLANKLTAVYRSNRVSYDAPLASELEEIEKQVNDRTQRARDSGCAAIPEARPSKEACQFCGVRQMCDEYWEATRQGRFKDESSTTSFSDVELTITTRHGPLSWDGTVISASRCQSGTSIVFRATAPGVELYPGAHIRVLDGCVVASESSEEPGAVALGTHSELFFVRTK